MRKITLSTIIAIFLMILGATTTLAQGDLTSIMRGESAIPESPTAARYFDLTAEPIIKSISDDYILGAGDILTINLGNITSDEVQQQISSQGDIMLPTVGKIKIAGLTVSQAEKKVTEECAKYFRNHDVRIQINQVRKIEVYLVGQVHQPGIYLCYAGTTVSQLLQLTSRLLFGDPSIAGFGERQFYNRTNPLFNEVLPEGSVRRVELKRQNGETIIVDLTKVIIKGMKELDPLLEHGDVVRIPPMKKSVIVKGGVNPGRYEILDGDTLEDIIEIAGGSGAMNLSEIIAVEKVEDLSRSTRMVNVATMRYTDDNTPFQLSEDTIIRIPQRQEHVYVIGAVPYPGLQDFIEGDTILDYIGRAGGFVKGEQSSFTHIIRRTGYGLKRESIRVDMKRIFQSKDVGDLMVYPGDIILVPPKNQPFTGRDVLSAFINLGWVISLFY